MAKRIGMIAGSGDIPKHILFEAEKQGYECIAAAIRGEHDGFLIGRIKRLEWFEIDKIREIASFFKENKIKEVFFAGKIEVRVLFTQRKFGKLALDLLMQGKDWSPTSLIQTAIDYFAKQGIEIIDPTPFLSACFCGVGVLTKKYPGKQEEEDISFGWEKAKILADLDIGQTLIVKNKIVVAVEGAEGTNEAIRRAGELTGGGFVVIKRTRTQQDPRIDLPGVGLETVKCLIQGRGGVLCFEADRMPFFQKEEALQLADENNILVLAR
ncbi:MAG: UDP-2,3-diacylglucosamine diphosphatase LpxI [Candidatus Aminicenantes bacterium]|nr:UDP-2,3-diacylglucosamine diphosphatase LpxI [Candidatus Aminicenantes bacterium]